MILTFINTLINLFAAKLPKAFCNKKSEVSETDEDGLEMPKKSSEP